MPNPTGTLSGHQSGTTSTEKPPLALESSPPPSQTSITLPLGVFHKLSASIQKLKYAESEFHLSPEVQDTLRFLYSNVDKAKHYGILQSPGPAFYYFARLPRELRDKIWDFAAKQPLIIGVKGFRESQRPMKPRGYTFFGTSPRCPLLLTSKEARAQALKVRGGLPLALSNIVGAPKLHTNLDIDTIYIQDFLKLDQFIPEISFGRNLQASSYGGLCRLAIHIRAWHLPLKGNSRLLIQEPWEFWAGRGDTKDWVFGMQLEELNIIVKENLIPPLETAVFIPPRGRPEDNTLDQFHPSEHSCYSWRAITLLELEYLARIRKGLQKDFDRDIKSKYS